MLALAYTALALVSLFCLAILVDLFTDKEDRLAEILSEDKPKKSRYDWSTANENDICALTWNDGRVSFLNQWPHRMDLVSHIEARPE